MNTTKWGPSGWVLLHKIAEQYEAPDTNNYYRKFFCSMKHVLPCIHCRRSYNGFLQSLPIDSWLQNNIDLSFFVYTIHNKVNEKLKIQGLLDSQDPTFKDVLEKYKKMECSFVLHACWKFLYTIVFNYPTDTEKQNEKKEGYTTFFNSFVHIFPCKLYRNRMIKYIKRHPIEKVLDTRNKLITWTYMLNCYIHRKFDYKVPDFEELYTEIETMRASCGKKTCRKPIKIPKCKKI